MNSVVVNQLGSSISSVAIGTQPAAAYGTVVTPGNLTYGSYAQLLSATAVDSCEVEIGINTVGVSGVARDCLVTVGWDPVGGANYGVTARTSIADLIASCASAYVGGGNGIAGGVLYKFPLLIPAGSTVAAKAMVNSATLTAINVYVRLRTRPSHPELLYVGQYVDTYGSNTGTAAGTAFTPGTTSRGSYVSLGSLTQNYRYFEIGIGCNNSVMSTQGYEVDLAVGDASNKDLVIESAVFSSSTIETLTKQANVGRHAMPASGQTLFARAQSSSAPNTGMSVVAYAVGG